MIEENGELLVLAHRKSGAKRYESMVFALEEGNFNKLFGVKALSPACSFCKYLDKFYLALGARDELTPDMGRVIAIAER